MAFFSDAGMVASGTKQPEKMRLCLKCGRSLEDTPEGYCCPVGHGCWTKAINSAQVNHSNYTGEGSLGSHAAKGKSSKGKTRKKAQKRQSSINKKYLAPYP